MSAYRDEDEGLRARRDELRAIRAAEADTLAPVAALYVKRAGELAAAVWLLLAGLAIAGGQYVLMAEADRRCAGCDLHGPPLLLFALPVLPIALAVSATVRVLARRSLRRDVGEHGPLREQIDRLERPNDSRDRLEHQLGWWLRLWIATMAFWPLPVASVLSLFAGTLFSVEVLAGTVIVSALVLPIAALRGHVLAKRWRRGEWQAWSWAKLGVLAALALVSIAERSGLFMLFLPVLVHAGLEGILELRLRADLARVKP